MTRLRLSYFTFLICMMPGMAMALEEPEYTIVSRFADFEVRRYAPYIVAEVDVSGEFAKTGNDAFRILASYIFGDNAATEKMSMTAPVESRPANKSQKMAMTAPVTATAAVDEDLTTYAFVMERKYTLDSLPMPNDDRVRIRSMPERTVAVRRYSGRWTESRYLQNKQSLRSALGAEGIQSIGQPTLARYNSPFSLPVFRRNEVMIEVAPGTVDDR